MSEKQEVVEQESKEMTPFQHLKMEARTYAMSSLIPPSLKGKPEDVFIILQTAKELGIGAMQALSGVNVIQGKPSISPELQLGLIKSKCPEAYIKVSTDEAKRSVTVTMAPSRARMDEAFTTTWDMDRAKAMGLSTKDNYVKQPMVMLRWRGIGEAARVVFPHVSRGLHNSEEILDFLPQAENKPSLKAIFTKTSTAKDEPDANEIVLPDGGALDIER